MPQHLHLVTSDRDPDIGVLIEQTHQLSEAIAEQGLELRLAVMQAKARIAELRATLRSIQRYL